MTPVSAAGTMAARIIIARAIGDERRAVLALLEAGFRPSEIVAEIDAAMALAAAFTTEFARAS